MRTDLKEHMSYATLSNLRKYHPTWKLIAADNAPFIISFLYKEFIMTNLRAIPESLLISHLEHHMEDIPHIRDNNKSAKDYLVEWSDDASGWLRRFYPRDDDEVHYDLTFSSEKSVEWLSSLKQSSFIGTESRLIMVFDLLHQIVSGTQTNPLLKLMELENKKADIEKEIDLVKKGEMKYLEDTQVKERFLQATSMAREILSDFRAVEQNFRLLNRNMREKIAKWDKSKGELVGDYFSEQNDIYCSDQGKSFNAFFEFIMSEDARFDFENTIKDIKQLDSLQGIVERSGIDSVVYDWLDGSKHVWRNIEIMSEQLRRYVDDNYMEEERRINQIIKNIEIKALELKNEKLKHTFFEVDELYPTIKLIYDRKLFTPPTKVEFINKELSYGKSEASVEELYAYVYVDKLKLIENIKNTLIENSSISLGEIIENHPLECGLTELLTYLSIDDDVFEFEMKENEYEFIELGIYEGKNSRVKIPKCIYVKRESVDE